MRGLAGYRDTGLAGLAPETTTVTVVDVLRWSSRGMVTADTDTPAATPIEGRLEPGFVISRHMEVNAQGTWTGVVIPSINEITLENTDRGLDGLGLTHVISGRPVTLKLAVGTITQSGRIIAPALTDFYSVWRGTVDTVSYDGHIVRLGLQADTTRLNRPLQQSTYGGSGGLDGSADLAGQTKPEVMGRFLSAEPVQIDPYLLIYQLRDGPMLAIDSVRDKGVALQATRDYGTYEQLAELIPEGSPNEVPDLLFGQYATCLAAGIFRTGGQPAGILTVDGRGRGDYIASAADQEPFTDGTFFTDGTGFINPSSSVAYAGGVRAITFHILSDYAGIAAEDIDENQILSGDDLNAGFYLPSGGQMTCSEAISLLMQSGMMFCGRDRQGKWTVGKIAPPSSTSTLTIDPSRMVPNSLRRANLPYRQPWPLWRVGYHRRWRPLTDSDMALGVTASTRARLRQPFDYIERVDTSLKVLYPEQKPGVLETVLAEKADAVALLDELFNFYTSGRQAYTLSAYGVSGAVDLGWTVKVIAPKLGMDNGKNLFVIGLEEDGRERRTNFVLFG